MEASKQILQTFGAILRQNRLAKGLSQERLALECGLDRTFISLLERGYRQPTLSSLFLICGPLDIRPNELIRQVEEVLEDQKTPKRSL